MGFKWKKSPDADLREAIRELEASKRATLKAMRQAREYVEKVDAMISRLQGGEPWR